MHKICEKFFKFQFAKVWTRVRACPTVPFLIAQSLEEVEQYDERERKYKQIIVTKPTA